MVFAPTHDLPTGAHEPAAQPRRRDHIKPPPAPSSKRLAWRAVVHPGTGTKAGTVQTTWHLVGCTGAHCPEGEQLVQSGGDPDGHCLVDGSCARCEERQPEQPEQPEQP